MDGWLDGWADGQMGLRMDALHAQQRVRRVYGCPPVLNTETSALLNGNVPGGSSPSLLLEHCTVLFCVGKALIYFPLNRLFGSIDLFR